MEIVNKNSYNNVLLHHLKIRQNNWRPHTSFPLLLWPYFATRTTYVKNYFVNHTHYECWVICNVEKGCLQVISNGKVYKVQENETILIPPGSHSLASPEGETIHRAMGIEGYLIRLILENLDLAHCIVIKDFLTEEYKELFEEVYHLLGRRDHKEEPHLSLLAYSILMYAAKFIRKKKLPSEIIACQQFIQRNLFQKITLMDLCKETGCSRTKLSLLFRQYTHFSPGEYITEERHKYARDLLATALHMPIKLVASHCGYRNQLYFANDFKKRTGMTPTLYRQKIQKKSYPGDEIFKNDSSV